MRYLPLLVILALTPIHGAGQVVYRCTSDEGPTIFQDAPCRDAHKTEELIELEPNVVDSSRMRANTALQQRLSAAAAEKRAQAAEQRKQARLERQKENAEHASGGSVPLSTHELVAELHKSRTSDSGRFFNSDPASRSVYPQFPERHVPEPPSVITSCDGQGCWDSSGRRYNSAAGPTNVRQDGKICQHIGNMMQCQ